ncbi:MAG: ATP-binding cassette domain-containing protein [Massilia sp.]|nr:ATP-binding cassette domain-containing protein [Massilia sp.]
MHKRYGNSLHGAPALSDINLHVVPGEMVAICSPSGHGKTSLLNLIGLFEAPSEGSVVIAGVRTSGLGEAARTALRGRLVGYVAQHFTLIAALTAQENVALPLMLRGPMDGAALADARALGGELLARLGMKSRAHHYPARLDPGFCQRVAIARALITRPQLVLADEATSRLDDASTRLVMDLFGAHQREYGTSIVLATRDQRQLGRAARTLQLNGGRLSSTAAHAPRAAHLVRA